MAFAVPGMAVIMENHLVMAVDVKNPSNKMTGIEPVYLEQYSAIALKSLNGNE